MKFVHRHPTLSFVARYFSSLHQSQKIKLKEVIKKTFWLLAILLPVVSGLKAQIPGQQRKVTITGLNTLVWLPADYNSTPSTKKYPLIIVLQGAGISDSASATHEGLTGKIAGGWNAEQKLPGGDTSKFIVISLTDHGYGWPVLDALMNYVVSNYKVDTNHIIGTGLSQGATDLLNYRTNNNTPSVTSHYMKVMVLLSIPSETGPSDANFAFAVPTVVRFVTGSADPTGTPAFSQNFADGFNKYNAAGSYLITIAGGGHNSTVWDSAYRTLSGDSVHNAFVWAIQVSPTGSGGLQHLTVNPGSNQTKLPGTISVTLTGNPTDPNSGGSINAYLWTRISGPNSPTISTATSSSTSVTGLIAGTYIFQLKVGDNLGVFDSATTQVIILHHLAVSAGSNQTLLPSVSTAT